MKVLVVGDQIADVYRIGTATRLCPEGPVPVVVETKPSYITAGGASLVAEQLRALQTEVTFIPLSHSIKERIFADDRLMLRIDKDCDSTALKDWKLSDYYLKNAEALVISDYGKGTEKYASHLMQRAREFKLQVFLDAKVSWRRYIGAFAAFPNEKEYADLDIFQHVIQKLGSRGCSVDGTEIVQLRSHAVRDVTGAGDIFMAAFVYEFLRLKKAESLVDDPDPWYLQEAARFANKVAGISVEFVGTHVVTWEEINGF